MPGVAAADELVAAAQAVQLTFDDVPSEPLAVGDVADVRRQEAEQIVERYDENGFAIIQLSDDDAGPDALVGLAESLAMGKPFLPPLYTRGGKSAPAVTRISASLNLYTANEAHPSFGRTVGQELHCDGTLQKIGFVKASFLLCESPAAEGGDTTLFNSSAAFARLVSEDYAAARALSTPGVLIRRATVNDCDDVNVGPAFTVQDSELVCGYSVSETDSWALPDGVAEADLGRGVDFLRDVSQHGSPYFRQLTLAPGQAILLDNTRISHGRTAYRDSETQRRCLYRSLHLEHPQSRTGDPVTVTGSSDTYSAGG